ncbi:MAG: cytochrome C [Deltaproteobacteria bacterium 21-66-5]|nr:MAG: cytochrome C [Deltaproteobacteria bacterium 21-66-5]
MKRHLIVLSLLVVAGTAAQAKEHPGKAYIEKNGYRGPATCEAQGCHPGTAKAFLSTVHWKHASPVANVENLDPGKEYGMKNRIYTMCNGNDIVNNLKEIPPNPKTGKTKFTGCNACHPGNHISDAGSTGKDAENAVDCLVCHSSAYDFRLRKPYKDAAGRVVMGQDRTPKAALSVGKPGVKNCMVCHEAAGGGVLIKRGFAFARETDVHAAKGMVCVDCHGAKDHKIPTGYDPNNSTAKDFTRWTQGEDGFFEPTTLRMEANETTPVYAWYNKTVRNEPHFIGPKGSRGDKQSRIYPFKLYEGKAYFDKKTGMLLSMDFAPPMATGDTLAGVASAAKTLGIKEYDPVPGWQTVYFGSSHLVTKEKALSCANCHAPNGALNFKSLGYTDEEIRKLTSAALYFDKMAAKQKENW